jgi:hypothetical protein
LVFMMVGMKMQKIGMDGKEGKRIMVSSGLKRALVGAVLAVETLTLAKPAAAEDTKGKIFVDSFDHTKTTSVAVGIARGFEIPAGLRIDASLAISSPGKGVDLESAELDLTTPKIGPVTLTTYIYKDRFYYTDRGLGAMLNIGNLHLAAEYDGGGLGLSFAKYKFKLMNDNVRLVPQVGVLYTDNKFVSVGGQLVGEVDVGGVTIFAKAVHFRDPDNGDWKNGNMQGGMQFAF